MTRLSDLDPTDLAVLAARLTDQVGDDAVRAHRVSFRIRPPRPGCAVLACRCGAVLDAAQMRRRRTPEPQPGAAARVDRITCPRCADPAVPLGAPTAVAS